MKKVCPTPWRIGHPTYQAADRQRITDHFLHQATLHPYKCRCALWHLTRNLNEELPTDQEAQPQDVARLQTLSATDFTDLVDADAKKTATAADRLALRHPDNLTRWRWSLKTLLRDVHKQLATTGTKDWEKKAHLYEDVLAYRLIECQALRAQASNTREAA
ncbi:hypothetical protein HY68_36665 [Streptomyces sp. AcH 505]|uniref:hypothetical protein n=1 Tax=Streptomyces sp. AcH 505 TaxID=352211 RepID=UPI000592316D|nr:hypothetical protein HY68_36665 [Streptomyces sp. AcH 505]